jgi:hypothetical protein
MVKCPYCPKKFPTHHGLGGHLSGPCGIKLQAAKAKAKPKPKPQGKTSIASIAKAIPVRVDFGPKMNAELRAQDRAKTQAAIPGKVVDDMLKLAAAHRGKADELEKMARRMRFLA